MRIFRKRRERRFSVTVQFDGRHPYLRRPNSYCVPSFIAVVQVTASGWNDAAKLAMEYRPGARFWSHYVIEVREQ